MNTERRIKTALEIAMEKTQNMRVDEATLQEIEHTKTAQIILGKFFNQPERPLRQNLKAIPKADQAMVFKALEGLLLSKLELPQTAAALAFNEKCLLEGLCVLKDKRGAAQCEQLLGLLEHFFKQREQVLAMIKQQLEPQIAQMQKQLAARLGQSVQKLTPEMHPEFQKRKDAMLRQFESQYLQELENVKQRIRECSFSL